MTMRPVSVARTGTVCTTVRFSKSCGRWLATPCTPSVKKCRPSTLDSQDAHLLCSLRHCSSAVTIGSAITGQRGSDCRTNHGQYRPRKLPNGYWTKNDAVSGVCLRKRDEKSYATRNWSSDFFARRHQCDCTAIAVRLHSLAVTTLKMVCRCLRCLGCLTFFRVLKKKKVPKVIL